MFTSLSEFWIEKYIRYSLDNKVPVHLSYGKILTEFIVIVKSFQVN